MAEKIINEPIEKDMRNSYLDYAMSVIVGRAIPDVRDGLKPVHRRVLYSMYELGNFHNKAYKKSARIVGDTMGRFHPHGDAAIYDTIVRMAQDFSMRYMLVDGHGNFGSIDGDNAAAMRYTEIRMASVAEEMLKDIEKNTVSFSPNFDGSLEEPDVLPSQIPNLLMNGSSGIAVGMATNIPPHNLNEVIDGVIALIDGATEEEIIKLIPGPDFPTGGMIVGKGGILSAYKTGKGIIRIRGRAEIDEKKREINITEIPYQVTKKSIIESIVNVVKAKRVDGISGVHDRSDRHGISIIIELKRDANPEVVLNRLYAYTPLENTFGIINLALVEKEPKVLPLKDMLNYFIEYRKEIVTKRCQFELNQAEERAHILEGLRTALANIDDIVPFLKKSKGIQEARAGLIEKYSLSEKQANAILEMKLSKLTSLEREKIDKEHEELKKKIEWLIEVLGDIRKILEIIKKELLEIKKKYGDERRTEILDIQGDITVEELIPNDQVVVVISNKGYVKRVGLDEYRAQRRGGKGVIGSETRDEDFVRDLVVTKNHNYLMFFTDHGRVFWLKAYEIPEAGRYAMGRSIVNILELKDEKVTSWISVPKFVENEYLIMGTKNGTVKRTSLMNFSRPRKTGIIAITLKEGDRLVDVVKTDGKQDIILATRFGQSIKFNETQAREIGRTAQGVRGIKLKNKDDAVVGMAVCRKPAILTITQNGFGKRTYIEEYRLQGRGGSGVINIKTSGRNGYVVDVKAVEDDDQAIVIGDKGKTIRIPVSGISVIGRNTQGVRIIKLDNKEKVASFAVVKPEEKEIEEIEEQEESKEEKSTAEEIFDDKELKSE